MFLGLGIISLVFGLLALWLLWPETGMISEGQVETEEEAPQALTAGRGLAALQLNVFPRQHDRPCSSCNGRALIWDRDVTRREAWTGRCRRCGIARLDVLGGMVIEV